MEGRISGFDIGICYNPCKVNSNLYLFCAYLSDKDFGFTIYITLGKISVLLMDSIHSI